MSVLHISLLGGLTLAWGDTSLPLPSGVTVRSLFAYLLTYRDRPHTRDLLAGTFWPELPDAMARRRLSQALWQIRHCLQAADLPQPLLLAKGDSLQLNPDLPLWLDVEVFRQRVAEGNLQDLKLAVALYQGDLLAGYYDDWLLAEQEQLREMFLAAVEQLVEGYKGRGEYEQALTEARRLAMEVPWREEAHREVMRLCHLLGRDNEALKQFEVCRQTLAEELDAEPSPGTVALAREIAERSEQISVLDLPKAPSHPSPIVLDSAEMMELPLVGREQERAELLADVQALFQGLGGLVLVEGEAGVGKTRLLRTVARDAEWRGAEVLWGEAQEMGPAVPYGPLAEALAEGLSPLRASQLEQLVDRIWLQVLSNLLPSLAVWLPDLPPAPELDPSQERNRLVSGMTHFLAGWRRIKPLLVVLENLHWMGEDTLDLLTRLALSLRERGVLLVGSYRGEDARALPEVWEKLQALDRAGVQHRLVLSGLDAAATGELVRRSLGLGTPVPLFETRLYKETEGNPLFVLEMLRTLYSEGLLARDAGGQWSTPWDETTGDYAELPLPRAVEQTIARRLAFLSPALQRMVHLAAVLGERFEFDLLFAANDEEMSSVLMALGELVRRRFLDETERDYRFSHDKIRQVAYEGIEAGERSSLHRQAAQALEAHQPSRVAALAHHWTRAEVWDKAADYHQQAGDMARAVYANVEAVAHYSQALATLERLAGPETLPLRFRSRLAREKIYDLLGNREAQARDLAGLKRLADALGSDRKRARVALRQARHADAVGDYPAAITAAQKAIHLCQADSEVDLEARGYRQWGRVLLHQGNLGAARSRLETAVELSQSVSQRQAEAESLHDLGTVFFQQSNHALARTCHEQSLHIYREIGSRQGEGKALSSFGLLAHYQGDYNAAKTYYEQALDISREIGNRLGEGRALSNLAMSLQAQGDYASAKTYIEQTLHTCREIGDQWAEGRILNNLGVIFRRQGDYASAKTHFEQALCTCREIGDRWVEGLILANLGSIARQEGEMAGARTHYERAIHIHREVGNRMEVGRTIGNLGIVCQTLGDYAAARTSFEQALHLAREVGDRSVQGVWLANLSLLSHHLGDDRMAARDGQQALLIFQDLGALSNQAYALTYLGHARMALGDSVEAIAAYQQALDLRRKLGQENLAIEPLAGLARVFMAQGNLAQSQVHLAEILAYLDGGGTLDGTDEPLRIYLTCYRVLNASHDPRAEEILHTAHSLLQKRTARIEDEELRHSYLENVAAHRELIVAFRQQQTVQTVRVRLPHANATTGRPLRDDEYVTITWTVDAPGDAKIPHKTDRRRRRIQRLLAEAQAQGAIPRDRDLAEVLGVSLPTIRRDMAALRAEGHDLPTRGRK